MKYEKVEEVFNVHKLISFSEEEIIAIQNSWDETLKANQELYNSQQTEIQTKLKEVDDLFKKLNISYKTQNGKIAAWYWDKIHNPIVRTSRKIDSSYTHKPYIHDYKYEYKDTSGTLSGNRDLLELWRSAKRIIEFLDQKEKTSNQILIKSILLANEHNFNIDGLNNEQIIKNIRSLMIDKYIEENYPDGTEVDISCCSECSTWVVGERRCSCGNRRMSFEIDGDVVNGFYAYPVAY